MRIRSAEATVRLKFKSKEQLESVFKALKPETRSPVTRRSKASIVKEGRVLTLKFEASDTSALRAAINSYLHWILLTRDVLDSLETK